MKKFLIVLLSLVLIVFCVGCDIGTYSPPIDNGGNGGNNNSGTGKDPNKDPNIDPDNPYYPGTDQEGVVFTVSLVTKNQSGSTQRFTPPADKLNEFEAQWMGESGDIHTANFDLTGTAAIILDGDYHVTLSKLPDNYTYNPNGLDVNNNKSSKEIELLEIVTTSEWAGRGYYGNTTGTKKVIEVSKYGAYKATLYNTYTRDQPWNEGTVDSDILNSKSDMIYYEYAAEEPGYFLVESMVDATDNDVNPTLWVMSEVGGNAQFKSNQYSWYKIDDGGASNTYTKNFRYYINLSDGFVGNTFTFGVYVSTTRQGASAWPITIYFRITYIGPDQGTVYAKGPFYTGPEPEGEWVWSYRDNPMRNGKWVTDGSGTETVLDDSGNEVPLYPMRFRLQWTDVDGDGKYTPAEWVDSNGNGQYDPGDEWIDYNGNGIFDTTGDYWEDNNNNGILDSGDVWEDTNGNGIFDPPDRWRDTNGNGEFDKGDAWWDYDGDDKCGLDTGDGFYHWYDPVLYADNGGWGPLLWAKLWENNEVGPSGNNKISDNWLVSEPEYKNYESFLNTYKDYSHKGAHPVNQEIMEALQILLVGNRYFFDGQGSAESKIDSYHDYMFLAVCGYFKKDD